jgi:hypothetical protein
MSWIIMEPMTNKRKPNPEVKPVMIDAHVLFEEDLWEQLVRIAKAETRRPSVLARLLVREALAARSKAVRHDLP